MTPTEQKFPAIAAIVVLNYRTAQLAVSQFHHLRAKLGSMLDRTRIIIVDNNSGAADVSILETAFDNEASVSLLLLSENGGYSRGNNVGIKYACSLGIPFCLVLNTDVVFKTENFLESLISASESLPHCGLIGPRIYLSDGREQRPIPEMTIYSSVFGMAQPTYEEPTEVYATTGCCVFGATKGFQAINFLDERFFLYREELVLAEKLRAHGVKWWFLPSVEIIHAHERKLRPLSRLWRHKVFEYQSTRCFFHVYKNVGAGMLALYSILFAFRTAVFIAFFCALGWWSSLRNSFRIASKNLK